jgi:hypothetical protein
MLQEVIRPELVDQFRPLIKAAVQLDRAGGGTSVDIESGTGGYRRNGRLPEKVIWFIIDRNLSALGTILAIVGKALSLKGYLIDLNRSRTFKSAGRIFTFNHQCHDKN